MINKVKLDVDILLLKKKILIDFAKIEIFIIFQTKSSLSTSSFIFSTIYQILKTKYEFWAYSCRNLKSIIFANNVP